MTDTSVPAAAERPLPVGVLRETHPGERRVALVPDDVRRLGKAFAVIVEEGAGAAAGFADEAYRQAGAEVAGFEQLRERAAVAVGVRPPARAAELREGTALVSLGGRAPALAEALRAAGVAHLGLERLPRTTRAQAMDALSSQATIAGYAAVLEGARHLPVILPMLTTAAGVIRPAAMIALGAGVAGLQALATARRLGAVTYGFDVREAAREQVESLGAQFVRAELALDAAEGANGYAREQSGDEQLRLRRALAPHLAGKHLIVATAQIPGKPAPLLIDDDTLAALDAGTVIVDLAAESGGNTSRTEPDQVVRVGGVTILGPTNLPSAAAADASRLFGGNVRQLLAYLGAEGGRLRLDRADAIAAALLGLPAPAPAPAAATATATA